MVKVTDLFKAYLTLEKVMMKVNVTGLILKII